MTCRVVLQWRDGREERLDLPTDEPVLGAAEDRGVALPTGCLTGACATCTGKVVEGDVDHCRPPRALRDRHREEGYALLCIACPRGDCRIEVGADVQTDLVDNPWR